MISFTDGAAKGRNGTGPSACAFVVQDDSGKVIYEGARFLGTGTNNYAEYKGLLEFLEWAFVTGHAKENITVFMDSQLVVKQVLGQYEVKHPAIAKLYVRVKAWLQTFKGCGGYVEFVWVPREQNSHADRLCNEVLNQAKEAQKNGESPVEARIDRAVA